MEGALAAATTRHEEAEESRGAMAEVMGLLHESVRVDSAQDGAVREDAGAEAIDASIDQARRRVDTAAEELEAAHAAAGAAREDLLELQGTTEQERLGVEEEVAAAKREVSKARRDKAMHTLAHRRMQRQASARSAHDVCKSKANTLLQTLDLRARLLQAHRPRQQRSLAREQREQGVAPPSRLEAFEQDADRAWSAEKIAQISQEAEILGRGLMSTQDSSGTQKDVRLFMLLAHLVEDQAQLRESLAL